MTNAFSTPLFADDRLIRESLEAAVRTIPKDLPMTRLGRWRREMEKYEALKANHPDMWKKLFGSDDQDDEDDDEEYKSDEDDDGEWDVKVEGLLTEEYTKFWDFSEKIINAGGMRMYEVMEVINYGKKNHLKYEEGKFKVLYA